MKVITFLFPRTGEIPIGGFKVVYEYANRLIMDGYEVNVVYGIVSRPLKNNFVKTAYYIFRWFRWIKYLWFSKYDPSKWFVTDRRIKHLLRYTLQERNIPASDFICATSWSTAVWLDKYEKISCNKKLYLIQHFENWHGSTEAVMNTWKMNLVKIVIAPWLQQIAERLNEKSYLIENGFNQEEFHITIPINKKNKYSAIMLWHDNPFKACHVGLAALLRVKEIYPQFTATMFGVLNRPKDLPVWINYYKRPSSKQHLDLYNRAAIFVGPSSKEGFCLTPPEAMLCGCAVACTNIGGYTVVAHHEKTALLSSPNNDIELANNIIRLIEDDDLRQEIARAGNALIKKFTWGNSYSKFKKLLESLQ